MSVRIVLADDHVLVRQSLKAMLEREGFIVVGEAAHGREAVRIVRQVVPDVAVLDIGMPLFNGLDAAAELHRRCPGVRIVTLTHHDEHQYVAQALRCGVKGYVLKNQVASDLVLAIRQVHAGHVYLSPGISRAVAETYAGPDSSTDALSVRERQVLQLIAESKSTKNIAALIGLSPKTVESHRTKLMRKLDIHDTAGLVRYAIRKGIIAP